MGFEIGAKHVAGVTALIAIADALTPLGTAMGVLYVLPVALTVGIKRPYSTLGTVVVACALTLTMYLAYADPWVWGPIMANRSMSVLAIVMTGVALAAYKRSAAAREADAVRTARLIKRTLDAAPDGMALVTPSGVIHQANDTLHRLMHVSPGTLAGKSIDELLPATLRGRHKRHREALALPSDATSVPMGRGPYQVERSDGVSMQVDVRLTSFDFEGTRFVAAAVRDVTAQQKLELRLQQTQRMEAIGRLAGGISHDFNNLLTVVTCHAEFAKEEMAHGPAALEHINIIAQSAAKAAALTAKILQFARRQVVRPERVNVIDTLGQLEPLWRRTLGEDITLVVQHCEAPWVTLVDPAQLERVLMNLVVNARDAMPRGGRLTVETSNVELDDEYCELHPEVDPGEFVRICVSDSGVGIAEKDCAKIFEPFFTTKENGTGLGLATAYGIVKQAGGHLWVYSEVGRGTSFKIYLPRAEDAATSSPPPPQALTPPRGAGVVLLVEDEELVRSAGSRALRRGGYDVIACANADAAVQAFHERGGEVDLLLTDVVMPGKDGRALADTLRAEAPRLRVLFMSGYTENAIVHHGVLGDHVIFLQKPFTPNQLLQKVRERLSAAD